MMSTDIVIVGSGFAARQLVKHLRLRDKAVTIRLIAADSCDEYNKPELSHVFSQRLNADALTRERAETFAEQNNLLLNRNTRVTAIDPASHRLATSEGDFTYGKLVLATGAEALVPAFPGSELMITLNSQQAFRTAQDKLHNARRVLLLGGGLIGTELAMDLNHAGKTVTLVERAASLLASLMPAEVSARLQHCLLNAGVDLRLHNELTALTLQNDALEATLSNGQQIECDAAICAVGLRPNIALAREAGLHTRRGIVVDDTLSTSYPDIFSLGDCAEISGQLMPYLQPAQMAALTLAKNLTGSTETLHLPAMLIKVKTPDLILHLAGNTTAPDLLWQMSFGPQGMVARGINPSGALEAFVVSEGEMKQAFALLKQLPK